MLRVMAVLLAMMAGLGPAVAQIQLFGPDKLIEAVVANDQKLAETYLRGGINPDRVNSYGKTGLIVAATPVMKI